MLRVQLQRWPLFTQIATGVGELINTKCLSSSAESESQLGLVHLLLTVSLVLLRALERCKVALAKRAAE